MPGSPVPDRERLHERGSRSASTAASGWRRAERWIRRELARRAAPRRRARRARRSSTIVRRGFEVEAKQRFLAGHRSRPRGRADHPRGAGARRAGRAGHRRRGSRGRAHPGARRHLFPGRSARRHQGIRPRRRRLYGQHRPDRATARRRWASSSRRRPGGCTAAASATGAWLDEGGGRHADPHARARRAADRGRLQVAPQPGDHRLSRSSGRRRAATSSVGSSLKFCIVAEGRADIYPRAAPTSEWDTAAGHAVLLAAGGLVDGPDGMPLRYGKPAFLNRAFVATAGWKPPPLEPFLEPFRRRRRPAPRRLAIVGALRCHGQGSVRALASNFRNFFVTLAELKAESRFALSVADRAPSRRARRRRQRRASASVRELARSVSHRSASHCSAAGGRMLVPTTRSASTLPLVRAGYAPGSLPSDFDPGGRWSLTWPRFRPIRMAVSSAGLIKELVKRHQRRHRDAAVQSRRAITVALTDVEAIHKIIGS